MRKKQRSFSLMKRRKKLHFSFSKAAIFGLLTLKAEGAVLLGRKRGLFNKFVKMHDDNDCTHVLYYTSHADRFFMCTYLESFL